MPLWCLRNSVCYPDAEADGKIYLDLSLTFVVGSTSTVVNNTRRPAAAKGGGIKLTKFELEVMEALWALGAGSVREIQEGLPARKRPAYTTVQTIVYRLEEKGALRRAKKIGNAHVFEPLVTRRAAVRRLLDDLLDFFGGSPRTLVAQLVETGRLTLEDVREVEGALARLEAGGGAAGAEDAGRGGGGEDAVRPARDDRAKGAARRGAAAKGRGRK